MNRLLIPAIFWTLIGCGPVEPPKPSIVTQEDVTAPINSAPKSDPFPKNLDIYRNKDGKVACPVMGNAVASPDLSVGFQDYKGVRYYFCCGTCPEEFKKSPEKYIHK